MARLLGTADPETLSAGIIAREAGVAYGTFYRYFSDRGHAVREALLRHGPCLEDVQARFAEPIGDREHERERVASWIRDAAADAQRRSGVVRAWHVYSNADEAVVKARRCSVEASVERVAAYLGALRDAGIGAISAPRFAAYALVALVVAVGRDAAHDVESHNANVDGVVALAWDLCGLN